MLPVGSVLVDFDGTACLHDVAEHLLIAFGDPSWEEIDRAWLAGEVDGRAALLEEAAMLRASTDELVAYARSHCPMDPTFGPFVAWCRGRGVPVTLVSDGFGFYIEPLLRDAGIDGLEVITNTWHDGDAPRLGFEHGRDGCRWCGTCKVAAVAAARACSGPVAFVGEGGSDRYGARAADLVFAKDELPAMCDEDGVPYLRWTDFDDVRLALEGGAQLHAPVEPDRCPGTDP